MVWLKVGLLWRREHRSPWRQAPILKKNEQFTLHIKHITRPTGYCNIVTMSCVIDQLINLAAPTMFRPIFSTSHAACCYWSTAGNCITSGCSFLCDHIAKLSSTGSWVECWLGLGSAAVWRRSTFWHVHRRQEKTFMLWSRFNKQNVQ